MRNGVAEPRWVVLRELFVREGQVRRFEQVYGPAGERARLLERAPGYVRTELWRDPATPGRYIATDHWTSAEAYSAFLSGFAAEHAGLEALGRELIERERHLGAFDSVRPSPFPHFPRTLEA